MNLKVMGSVNALGLKALKALVATGLTILKLKIGPLNYRAQ